MSIDPIDEVKLSGRTYAKGRNGYFQAGAIEVLDSFPVTQDDDTKGVRLEVRSAHHRGGENPIVLNLLPDEAAELAYKLFQAVGQEVLYLVSEADLAYQYDRAACPDCRNGED